LTTYIEGMGRRGSCNSKNFMCMKELGDQHVFMKGHN
jgi:hypothetical protein